MSVHRKPAPHNIVNLNQDIVKKFNANQNNNDIRKTHLFEGRYENIYLSEQQIPELKILIDEAVSLAEDILMVKNISAGYWFNAMPPESTTTLHSHDDFDELLSAVYYLHVPEDSGNLIVYNKTVNNKEEKIEITPHAGEFIFFKPDIKHEVGRNNSNEYRLSIGINFGVK